VIDAPSCGLASAHLRIARVVAALFTARIDVRLYRDFVRRSKFLHHFTRETPYSLHRVLDQFSRSAPQPSAVPSYRLSPFTLGHTVSRC
jgi:hypothetical protein